MSLGMKPQHFGRLFWCDILPFGGKHTKPLTYLIIMNENTKNRGIYSKIYAYLLLLILFKISRYMDFRLFLFLQNHSYVHRPNFTLAAVAVLLDAATCRTGPHPQLHRQDIVSEPTTRAPKLGRGPHTTPASHRITAVATVTTRSQLQSISSSWSNNQG